MSRYYLPHKSQLTQISRELRNQTTKYERFFWHTFLAKDKTGYRFLRQKPILYYIVDFYCPKLKLAVELDGYSHVETSLHDSEREKQIIALGIKFIRYTNYQIIHNADNIYCDLYQQIKLREKELGSD